MGNLKIEIKNAIDAHLAWKKELKSIIRSGRLDTPINIIEKDDECDFGRWLLNSNCIEKEQYTMKYNEIVVLHSEFHKLAGKIATLAIHGKKDAQQTYN